MRLEELNPKYDKLQLKYGDPSLHSIYNGGQEKNPNICFVFMNPTGKNIASLPDWKGIYAPWLGTKSIWDLFIALNLIDKNIYDEIKKRKPNEWNEEFALNVYNDIKKHNIFITNLGKCTQIDARVLKDEYYLEYRELLLKEIEIINPKVIVLFGNQVSSIVLEKKISVSIARKEVFEYNVGGKKKDFYSVFYPVGNGRFNIDKSIEDIKWIIEKYKFKN